MTTINRPAGQKEISWTTTYQNPKAYSTRCATTSANGKRTKMDAKPNANEIVRALRRIADDVPSRVTVLFDAADLIESLTAQLAEAEEALERSRA